MTTPVMLPQMTEQQQATFNAYYPGTQRDEPPGLRRDSRLGGRRAVPVALYAGNRGGKIDVPQLDPGFIEDITKPHRYQLQMGCEPLIVASRQGVEEMILMGIGPATRTGRIEFQ